MSLVGARVVGLLLVWMAAGFAFDAATAEYQHERLVDALEPQDRDGIEPPTLMSRLVVGGVGAGLLLAGLGLLARPPGRGHVPDWRLGDRVEAELKPGRCYRCRASWPAEAERCPQCGAERLS